MPGARAVNSSPPVTVIIDGMTMGWVHAPFTPCYAPAVPVHNVSVWQCLSCLAPAQPGPTALTSGPPARLTSPSHPRWYAAQPHNPTSPTPNLGKLAAKGIDLRDSAFPSLTLPLPHTSPASLTLPHASAVHCLVLDLSHLVFSLSSCRRCPLDSG